MRKEGEEWMKSRVEEPGRLGWREWGGSGAYLLQEMSCQRERATKSAGQRSYQLASVSSKICWTDEEQGRQLVGGAAGQSRVKHT